MTTQIGRVTVPNRQRLTGLTALGGLCSRADIHAGRVWMSRARSQPNPTGGTLARPARTIADDGPAGTSEAMNRLSRPGVDVIPVDFDRKGVPRCGDLRQRDEPERSASRETPTGGIGDRCSTSFGGA